MRSQLDGLMFPGVLLAAEVRMCHHSPRVFRFRLGRDGDEKDDTKYSIHFVTEKELSDGSRDETIFIDEN